MGCKMKIFSWLSALALCSLASSTGVAEPLDCRVTPKFSSEGSLGRSVQKALRASKSKVLLALYGFNNPELADELIELARRGVSVRVKVDAGKSADKKTGPIVDSLKAAGIEVQTVAPEGRNHNKFAVVDGTLVITGSYNWTLKAESNWENLLFLECPELARRYEKEWETIR